MPKASSFVRKVRRTCKQAPAHLRASASLKTAASLREGEAPGTAQLFLRRFSSRARWEIAALPSGFVCVYQLFFCVGNGEF